MRRIITLALLAIVATAGTAAADRYRGDRGRHEQRYRDHRHDRGRVVVRDHRYNDRRVVVRQPRRVIRDRVRNYIDYRPVYANNNRFTFRNGRTFYYQRPTIQYRYTDYRYRPQLLVENYETVPGYIWIAGRWDWNGYEWVWIGGHYQVDTNYGYDDAYYYNSPVADHDCY